MFINEYIYNTVYFDILITGFSANALYCRGMKWHSSLLRTFGLSATSTYDYIKFFKSVHQAEKNEL